MDHEVAWVALLVDVVHFFLFLLLLFLVPFHFGNDTGSLLDVALLTAGRPPLLGRGVVSPHLSSSRSSLPPFVSSESIRW